MATYVKELGGRFEVALDRIDDERVRGPIMTILDDHAPQVLSKNQTYCPACHDEWPCKPIADLALRMRVSL